MKKEIVANMEEWGYELPKTHAPMITEAMKIQEEYVEACLDWKNAEWWDE